MPLCFQNGNAGKKDSTWPNCPFLDGYIVTALLSGVVLFISLYYRKELCYWWAFPPAIVFSGIQLIRICRGLMPKPNNDVSFVYGYAFALAKRRSLLEETTSEDLTNDERRNTQWRRDSNGYVPPLARARKFRIHFFVGTDTCRISLLDCGQHCAIRSSEAIISGWNSVRHLGFSSNLRTPTGSAFGAEFFAL